MAALARFYAKKTGSTVFKFEKRVKLIGNGRKRRKIMFFVRVIHQFYSTCFSEYLKLIQFDAISANLETKLNPLLSHLYSRVHRSVFTKDYLP